MREQDGKFERDSQGIYVQAKLETAKRISWVFLCFFFPLFCAVLRVSVVLDNYFLRLFGYVDLWSGGDRGLFFFYQIFLFFWNACSSDLFILSFAAQSNKVGSVTV
jgi:hypothetical protein